MALSSSLSVGHMSVTAVRNALVCADLELLQSAASLVLLGPALRLINFNDNVKPQRSMCKNAERAAGSHSTVTDLTMGIDRNLNSFALLPYQHTTCSPPGYEEQFAFVGKVGRSCHSAVNSALKTGMVGGADMCTR